MLHQVLVLNMSPHFYKLRIMGVMFILVGAFQMGVRVAFFLLYIITRLNVELLQMGVRVAFLLLNIPRCSLVIPPNDLGT